MGSTWSRKRCSHMAVGRISQSRPSLAHSSSAKPHAAAVASPAAKSSSKSTAYPWHLLTGRTFQVFPYRRGKGLRCVYTDERPDLCRELPNWMFDASYCVGMKLGSPEVSIEGLNQLAAVLAELGKPCDQDPRCRSSKKEKGHAPEPVSESNAACSRISISSCCHLAFAGARRARSRWTRANMWPRRSGSSWPSSASWEAHARFSCGCAPPTSGCRLFCATSRLQADLEGTRPPQRHADPAQPAPCGRLRLWQASTTDADC